VDEKTTTVRKGRQVVFGEALVASNFDTNDSDPFYRWASRRAEYISAANLSSARTAGASSGYGSGLLSSNYGGPCSSYGGLYPNYTGAYSGCPYGAWAWNPWFGMYTYVPGFGYGYSPFGWDFFSPYTVAYAYAPYLYGGTTYGGTTSRLPAVGRVTPPTENNVGRTALMAARFTSPSASPAASASSASSSSNGSRLGGSSGVSGSSGSGGGFSGGARGGSSGGGRR
jgi:hypothetical protein